MFRAQVEMQSRKQFPLLYSVEYDLDVLSEKLPSVLFRDESIIDPDSQLKVIRALWSLVGNDNVVV
jgi:hypothetical protein